MHGFDLQSGLSENQVAVPRFRVRRSFARLLPCLAILLLSAGTALSQSLVLEGDYIRTGVSSNGTLGVGGSTSPGFIFDDTGTGTFNPANDYLTPGTPHEGFSISYTSAGVLVNNNTGTQNIGTAAAPTTASNTFDHSVEWSGTIASTLTIEHVYGLNDESKQVSVTTTVTALTDLQDVKYARWIDPDSGGYASENSRGNATLGLAAEDWVNSVSETNGATLGLYSASDVTHNTAISPGWSTDPDDYLAGSADMIGDYTIGIGFDLGDLSSGDSVMLQYFYAVAADPDEIEVAPPAWDPATFNQNSLATWLDATAGGASADLASATDAIRQLSTSEDERAAMDQIDGEIYPTLALAGIQLTDMFYSRLSRNIRSNAAAARSPASSMIVRGQNVDSTWTGGVFGHGIGGSAHHDGNASGFGLATGGTTVLLERDLDGSTEQGMFFEYASSYLDLTDMTHFSNIDNYRWGGYLAHDVARGYWSLAGSFGYDSYRTARVIDFGTGASRVLRTAEADHDGWQAGVYVERGWNMNVRGNIFLQPFVALQYLHLRENEAAETGANSLNIISDQADLDSLRTRVGATLELHRFSSGKVSFESLWTHELLDETAGLVNNRLSGASGGTTFAVRGVDLGRDWLNVGPRLEAQLTSRARLFGSYDLSLNCNQTFHTGSGGIEVTW